MHQGPLPIEIQFQSNSFTILATRRVDNIFDIHCEATAFLEQFEFSHFSISLTEVPVHFVSNKNGVKPISESQLALYRKMQMAVRLAFFGDDVE